MKFTEYISKVQPTRCYVSQSIYFNKTLYMFQAVPLPIIRSSNCTYSFWYLSDLAICHWEELKLYIQLLIFVRPCYLPLRGAQTVRTASDICQTLLLPATERSSNCTYSFWYLSNLAAACHWEELKLYIQLLIFVRPCYLPLRGAQTVHTASDICQTLLLPAAIMLATGGNKVWQIPEAVCTIWAPDDGRRNRLKHVQRFI
jgi:hypothetical protein